MQELIIRLNVMRVGKLTVLDEGIFPISSISEKLFFIESASKIRNDNIRYFYMYRTVLLHVFYPSWT